MEVPHHRFRLTPLFELRDSPYRRDHQYQSHTLVQHIQRGWSLFSEEMNEFCHPLPAQQRMKGENWYRGTADAVTQNLDIIRRYKAEYVVIRRRSYLQADHFRVC